jgi:hypothetical protein
VAAAVAASDDCSPNCRAKLRAGVPPCRDNHLMDTVKRRAVHALALLPTNWGLNTTYSQTVFDGIDRRETEKEI